VNTATCEYTQNKTKPYGLVLGYDVLEDRDLVVADWVALTDANRYDWGARPRHEAVEPSWRRGVDDTWLNQIQDKQKDLVVHDDHAGGFISQSRAECGLFHLHFILPCHTNFDAVVSSRQQMLPFCCQRPARITEILEGASEEAEHWIVVRLSAPRQDFV
jgi:hypothetical protein